MQLTRILDDLLSSAGKVRILRELIFRKDRPMSGHLLASYTGLSPSQSHKILHELHRARVVQVTRVGNSHCYTVSPAVLPVTHILKPLFESERSLLDEAISSILDTVKTPCDSVYLFGSVSRGDDDPESDMDLAFVTANARNKQSLDDELLSSVADVADERGITLGSTVFTRREVRDRFKAGDAFVREIFLKGRCVRGDFLMSDVTR